MIKKLIPGKIYKLTHGNKEQVYTKYDDANMESQEKITVLLQMLNSKIIDITQYLREFKKIPGVRVVEVPNNSLVVYIGTRKHKQGDSEIFLYEDSMFIYYNEGNHKAKLTLQE